MNMNALEGMTFTDMNRMVAEALEFEKQTMPGIGPVYFLKGTMKKKEASLDDVVCSVEKWLPHKKLSQITRYGVPWLKAKGYCITGYFPTDDRVKIFVLNDDSPFTIPDEMIEGHGEYADEKMAWALSLMIVKVADDEI